MANNVVAAGASSGPVVPSRQDTPIYACTELDRELRQAEIISGLKQHSYDSSTDELVDTLHPYSIIISQDCDLLWDYEARRNGKPPILNGVLICEIWAADKKGALLAGGDVWRRVKHNKDERYHFLEAAPAEQDAIKQGVPELVVDFKRYFTLPPDEIFRQLQGENPAARRCRLLAPYKDHLQSRVSFYLQRVMLPRDHESRL
jgi:hypothetical protein